MLRNSMTVLAMLAALALVAGCSGSQDIVGGGGSGGGADDGDVSASQMAEVALDSDLVTEEVLNAELDVMAAVSASTTEREGGSGTIVQDVTFSRTRSCPLGGQVSLQGSIHRTFNRDTGVMEAESSGSRTRTDCMFPRDEGTITVNGASQWDAFRRRVFGQPDGPQTTHYSGSWMAVRSDGEERSCSFDIMIVRDPGSHTRTLDGMICGVEVHRTVTWSHGE